MLILSVGKEGAECLMYLDVNRCANEMPVPKTPDSIMSRAPLMK
jgi:hypothetical protein